MCKQDPIDTTQLEDLSINDDEVQIPSEIQSVLLWKCNERPENSDKVIHLLLVLDIIIIKTY